jgi:homoserine acetyltransferase
MLALEWILCASEAESAGSSQLPPVGFVRSAVLIGCSAQQGAWQIAHSELQRRAIYNDLNWDGGNFLSK